MHNVLVMNILNSLTYLYEPIHRLSLIKSSFRLNILIQISSFAIFHSKIDKLLVFKRAEQFEYKRVFKLLMNIDFF